VDLFAKRRLEQQEQHDRHRVWLVVAVLLILILGLLWFLYAGMTQDRDFLRGDEHFAKQRWADALGYYLRSEKNHTWGKRPRLTYRIAISYERLKQYVRSVDYFMQLQKNFPTGEWGEKSREALVRVLEIINTQGGGAGVGERLGGLSTPLTVAKAEWHKSYNHLILAVRENGPGVSASLEQAYQDYKAAYQKYVREIEQGLRRLDSEGL
jgi:tetratricopeptide (TPR) repeat protein